MKKFLTPLFLCLILCIALPAVGDEGGPEDGVVVFIENGTLYSDFIHHHRPGTAIAETPESRKEKSLIDNISYSVSSDFRSRYVSYALAASDGWVWQPAATIEWYGLGFNVWSNFVLDNIPDQGKFNEVDLTLYYDYCIKGFTIHPYFTSYIYPTSNKRSLDYSAYTDVLPSLHLAYSAGPLDFFADVQLYVHPTPGALRAEFGIGLTHELPFKFGVQTSGIVGFGNSKYNRSVFGISENAFNYFTYNLAFPWNPIKGFVVSPNMHVSSFFAQKFRDRTQYPVLVWGGVDFSYNF
jgi:hypothetical protein